MLSVKAQLAPTVATSPHSDASQAGRQSSSICPLLRLVQVQCPHRACQESQVVSFQPLIQVRLEASFPSCLLIPSWSLDHTVKIAGEGVQTLLRNVDIIATYCLRLLGASPKIETESNLCQQPVPLVYPNIQYVYLFLLTLPTMSRTDPVFLFSQAFFPTPLFTWPLPFPLCLSLLPLSIL